MRKVLILSFLAALFVAVTAVYAQYGRYPQTFVLRDSSVAVTADTTLVAVNTSYADFVTVTMDLATVGGSGTYAMNILTSPDGVVWDSTGDIDTIAVSGQSITYSLSHYNPQIARGPNAPNLFGATGANAGHVPLQKYLKVRINEDAASTGSEMHVQIFLNNYKPIPQP